MFQTVLKGTKITRAVKVIPKEKVTSPDRFKTEVDIMRKLDHPQIIRLYDTFENSENIYLVLE